MGEGHEENFGRHAKAAEKENHEEFLVHIGKVWKMLDGQYRI